MTGIDTNVLVRYLTEDDPVQAKRAAAWINTMAARADRVFVSAIVLCELTWVLRGAYKISKDDLLLTLDRLLATSQFVIGDKDVVRRAVAAYRSGRVNSASAWPWARSRGTCGGSCSAAASASSRWASRPVSRPRSR